MVNKMNGESVDLTAQNIARLKELFPEILTDGEKIDFDMLKTVLGGEVDSENERYQFTWHGKKKMIAGTQKPSKGTLRPDKEKSKNFDTTKNLYIEGDNLEVLKLLQKSYNNKIKMIYIDPPYNTGKDFVYKDNFKDSVQNYLEQTGQVDSEGNILATNAERNGRFHTDWLNMIYARLKISRNLLTREGVIFISIDENEVNNLRNICNEIFGEKNFIAQITTLCNPKGRSQDLYFATNHEYVLIYSKTKLSKGAFSINKSEKQILLEYPEIDDSGERYRLLELRNTHREFGKHNRKNLYYPFYVNPETGEVTLNENPEYILVYPKWEDGFEGCWTWDINKSRKDLHLLVAKKIKENWKIYRKSYAGGARKMLKTIFSEKEYATEKGQLAFSELFATREKLFQAPKSVSLIKDLLLTTVKESDTILDFFSGSATTAHATMQLNAKDGGNRKFIMVQLPEFLDENSEAYKAGYRTICDIGEERIRRAGEKIKAELIETQQNSGMLDENVVDPESIDIGFKVLKLDTSNIREWNVDFADLENKLDLYDTPFIEDRSELDVVYEIMLKQGLELTYPIETFEVNGQTVYDIAFGSLFVCLSQKITADIAKAIIARRDDQGTDTSSVIFSDAGFATDSDKLNCIEILKDAGYPEDNLLTL